MDTTLDLQYVNRSNDSPLDTFGFNEMSINYSEITENDVNFLENRITAFNKWEIVISTINALESFLTKKYQEKLIEQIKDVTRIIPGLKGTRSRHNISQLFSATP